MKRREFVSRSGWLVAAAALGAGGATAVEERRLDVTITASGHAVGADRPPGLLSTSINYRIATDEPVVALTFDDGPSAQYTDQVLSILAAKAVRATFFLIGEHVQKFPQLAKQVAASHEVGNHTWSHPNMALYHAPDARDQLTRAEQIIVETIGRPPTAFRPPYGSFSGATAMIATSMRYPIVLWDIEFHQHSLDTGPANAERISALAGPGSIILGHDGGTLKGKPLVDGLAELIDRLRARGLGFVTISELLARGSAGSRTTSA
jgi:peptidoglycan/xylan/chitin deacetylase (PgdA/CDA1 family)